MQEIKNRSPSAWQPENSISLWGLYSWKQAKIRRLEFNENNKRSWLFNFLSKGIKDLFYLFWHILHPPPKLMKITIKWMEHFFRETRSLHQISMFFNLKNFLISVQKTTIQVEKWQFKEILSFDTHFTAYVLPLLMSTNYVFLEKKRILSLKIVRNLRTSFALYGKFDKICWQKVFKICAWAICPDN